MGQWESQTRKMNNHYQSVNRNNTGDEDDEIQQDESSDGLHDETID